MEVKPENPDGPYLSRVKRLQHAYPGLNQLLNKISNKADQGRLVVDSAYKERYGRPPGRCAVLEFTDDGVKHEEFNTADGLRLHLETIKAQPTKNSACRLYVLEDLEPGFVETLGEHVGVDPHVFAEQMNTWNFTDVKSVGHRALPSMMQPGKAFTLRYYEFRGLDQSTKDDISSLGNQMSFAVNRRWYEPWMTIDGPSLPNDDPLAFLRRCASFWTSQSRSSKASDGWNAVMLVDPALDTFKAPSGRDFYIFKGEEFQNRNELWYARDAGRFFRLVKFPHSSEPYHKGCPTIYPLSFCSSQRAATADLIANTGPRSVTSPFDETIFYWTNLADKQEIRAAKKDSVNTAQHLLKFVAYYWIHTLEVVSHTLAQSEYFSDDNPATKPEHMSTHEWKHEFYKVVKTSHKINYFRRQMIYFENAMTLNLERLGISLDGGGGGGDFQSGAAATVVPMAQALSDAQKDFKTLASRLRPLLSRADNLSTVANDIASLRAAFQAIEDSATGLSLSILATVIFPFTLVASMFSMADNFLPGKRSFWVFFAVSIPLTIVISLVLVVARRWGSWRDSLVKAIQARTTGRNGRASGPGVKIPAEVVNGNPGPWKGRGRGRGRWGTG
ncbi:hypothetical protein A1O1_02496 [Capronia coronata CBS 617.96]|uniref:Uncharacterized protein n=1 Tax=Capronia coronata CBS 617.96 TaxID=1182541 RepID=W9YNH4_9EURO|nr:uncharacterized protein A1O1_02496 [Capronia coronata CBS 617.96]EXJ94103.1 hypothetical protein A1O1_02496 [Capronia coronata CBS 617.96]